MKLIDLVRNFDEEIKIKVVEWVGTGQKEKVYYEGSLLNLPWWIAECKLDNDSANCKACYIDGGILVIYVIGE